MKTPALMIAVLLLASAVAPAIHAQNAPFKEPTSAAEVLDACAEAVSELDSPPEKPNGTNLLKFGWCIGWVQGVSEHIAEAHAQERYGEMLAKKDGKPAPAPGLLDQTYLSICLPPSTRTQDLMRTIVKGLRDTRDLHEPKNRPVKDALRRLIRARRLLRGTRRLLMQRLPIRRPPM